MVSEFVKSQRGKPRLKHEGYLYCFLREKDGLKTRRCDKRQCKAIATTFEDNVFTTREHLHEPDSKHSEQLKVLEKMTPRLKNSCSICARSRASLKTALQEYAQEKFCQSMPKWSVNASVFSNFSTIIKTIICCLF